MLRDIEPGGSSRPRADARGQQAGATPGTRGCSSHVPGYANHGGAALDQGAVTGPDSTGVSPRDRGWVSPRRSGRGGHEYGVHGPPGLIRNCPDNASVDTEVSTVLWWIPTYRPPSLVSSITHRLVSNMGGLPPAPSSRSGRRHRTRGYCRRSSPPAESAHPATSGRTRGAAARTDRHGRARSLVPHRVLLR